MTDFNQAFQKVIVEMEGKYSNDASDPGGETVWGLIRSDDSDWPGWKIVDQYKGKSGYPNNLPFDQLADLAKPYWKKKAWDYALLDQYPDQELAEKVFRIGVNMGKYWGGAFLQRSLNVLNRRGKDYPDLKVDGQPGAKTLAAVNAYLSTNGNVSNLIKGMDGLQTARYIALGEGNEKLEDFENGWLNTI